MLTLAKLSPEDIDEKIRLNEQDGIDIYKLKELIKEELTCARWIIIRNTVQCQCYEEQLDHIEKVIKEREKCQPLTHVQS